MGTILHEGLQRLKARYPCIGDVRGRGLMAGLEIIHLPPQTSTATTPATKTHPPPANSKKTPPPPNIELSRLLARKMYDLGLWANLSSHASFGGVFRIAPPIVVAEEEIRVGLEIMERAFAEVLGSSDRE
jgi:4-aminobutyrate aminotransferase-like enzyme